MSRPIRPAAPRELDAWRNLADLRINHLNVHPGVTVADYNQRFGTKLATWEAVAEDVATRTVLAAGSR
jgi:hypothetical protein